MGCGTHKHCDHGLCVDMYLDLNLLLTTIPNIYGGGDIVLWCRRGHCVCSINAQSFIYIQDRPAPYTHCRRTDSIEGFATPDFSINLG